MEFVEFDIINMNVYFEEMKKYRHLQDLNLRGLPHEISSLTP